ncbi:MAG: hypothetical protein Kow00108_26100 [Calditrichia bacterium]
MIIVGTAGKVLATTGMQGADVAELNDKIKDVESQFHSIYLENQSISVNDENLLGVEIKGTFYPFSMVALQSLCKILKVPANYLNKLISNDLTLKNINEHPLKMGIELNTTIWNDDEDKESAFIAGFSVGNYLSNADLLNVIDASGMIEKNNLKLHHWLLLPDLMVLNYLQNEVHEVKENNLDYIYQLGISVYYSESTDQPFQIVPFYHVRFRLPNGEYMEWDFETKKVMGKVGKKGRNFSGEIQTLVSNFEIGKLSEDFMNMKYLIESAGLLSEVKYKIYRSFFSAAKSIFTHYTLPDTGTFVKTDIFPEFEAFKQQNKERMNEMEAFQVANLLAPVSLPVVFNRIYYSQLLLENPYFMLRSRQGIYKMMFMAAEEVNLATL